MDRIPLPLDKMFRSTILALGQAVPPEDPLMRLIQLGARTPQMTPTSSRSDKSCTGNPLGPKGISTTLLRRP